MRSVKLTRRQAEVLRLMTPRDLRTLRRHPRILDETRQLIKALKRVVKHIEKLHQYANARKRQTAYKRIATVCVKALERVES